jgi:adenine-specific DNA glycosylase
MSMLSKQIEGLREEINQIFPEYNSPAETMQRLIETGNHASLPKCRHCPRLEECLENGPRCANVRRTLIIG